MKTTILRISVFLLLLSLMGAGCEKEEELFWEISPNSKSAVIQKEVNGVEFKFCLLNEQGEPATVFNEGENFTFLFSSRNKRKDTLYFDRGIIGLPDFCEVKNHTGEQIGSPFMKPVLQELIGRGAYPFQPQREYVFEVLWSDGRQEWKKWHGIFNGTNQIALPKGKYYTQFAYQFNFGSLKTDLLSFKINFEIK
jgi:hypothetical protein